MIAAEREILILAWELHTRAELVRPPAEAPPGTPATDDGWPTQLGDLLYALVEAKPALTVRILLWDFAMIYAAERELVPIFRLPWRRHPRIRLQMDSAHPPGAAQHQKIVVVDDKVAFSGGLDLTANRWDTREHAFHDPRRVNPAGERYNPFHDAMILVDGACARALSQIARERWEIARGARLDPPQPKGEGDPWPAHVAPTVRDVRLAIARTWPAYRQRPEVREVERLFLDSIARARHAIYIEQQYFTSAAIGEALERSLALPEGPDIVIVLPYETSGWLEETSMGVGRVRLQRNLEAADKYGRLRVYQLIVPGGGLDAVKLHAKLMTVDDRLLRVGSANTSNRSMGFDSECDVALEADPEDPRIARTILGVRHDLLAEHLGTDAATVADSVRRHGGLIAGIEALRPPQAEVEAGTARTLIPLTHEVPAWMERLVPPTRYLDPERAIQPDRLLASFMPARDRDPDAGEALPDEDAMTPADTADSPPDTGPAPNQRRRRLKALARFTAVLVAVSALALLWSATPLKELTSVDAVLAWARGWADEPLAWLYALLGYVIGGFLAVPVTVMITVTGILFGPIAGFATAMAGSLVSAALLYGVGHRLGRDAVRRLSGPSINRISERLSRHGVMTVALLRMVPVAPFSVINVAAGAIRIRLRDFLLGTAVGMAPGMAALTVFGDRVEALLRDPTPARVAMLAGALVLVLGVTYLTDRWASRRRRRREALYRQRERLLAERTATGPETGAPERG
jgi:phosphatidylserine/phosphatidylglycerophosphate/cardiolipin synthase-like enzyme/uncharacterized membrane protein YdjX (TVP38/TMEM64 family)